MIPSASHHSYAVLVVEDDAIIRMMAMDLVQDTGFIAYEAANADDALVLLEERPDIRILFTDIDMPGSMDGLALAHKVRDRWPPMFILVASGHIRITQDKMPLDGQFVSKPYPPSVIIGALNKAASKL
jgi:CheY-like chemotaxis protein